MVAHSGHTMPASILDGDNELIGSDLVVLGPAIPHHEIGLSQWEALALMRQGFIRVFLPSADRLIFDLCATPVP